ncbi:MAG: transposase [Myxococcales bacterium]|nr:transposase [Myxococcales bacterium]
MLAKPAERARREHLRTGDASRAFKEIRYLTQKTWSCTRRVIGKAEHLSKGANHRFVVTSLSSKEFEKRYVYEYLYCARGEIENRIKEVQLELFGDRVSCHTFRGNAIRLWFAMAAQLLTVTIRNVGLVGTELARAQAGTNSNASMNSCSKTGRRVEAAPSRGPAWAIPVLHRALTNNRPRR